MLASRQYTERHDNMLRVVYYKLLMLFGFADQIYPWYKTEHVESVKENDECIIYWNYAINTVYYVKNNKPDICVILKKKDVIWIIEGSCPWDTNIAQKINEKKVTYIPLGTQLRMMYSKSKVITVELVIGATGTVHKSLHKMLQRIIPNDFEIVRIIEQCQKAVILGSVRIHRQVLS